MESKIYKISKDELNALLFFYYSILYGLDNYKGIKYKSCFDTKMAISKLIPQIKDKNINDFIEVL